MAEFVKQSPLTGLYHRVHIPYYTQDDFELRYNAWKDGRCLIQEAFPELSADVREFLRTGITPQEWADNIGTD